MKILFLTLAYQKSSNSIYTDLMRELYEQGNEVYVVTALERREQQRTSIENDKGIKVLRVKTLNIQKTNIIEKGIGTLTLEGAFINGIKKFYSEIKFDLVLYSTPPITFEKIINFIKKRDKASSYLLLKDIFPQNAIDIEMFSEKSLFYKFFRNKEKKLYKISDYIGCMSPKNVEYLIKHNNFLSRDKIEICPNSIFPTINKKVCNEVKGVYGIKNDELLVIYGGNLGKPQGINFLIEILKSNKNNNKVKFLIIGSGTEEKKLQEFVNKGDIKNVILKSKLPKDDYDNLVRISDIGLILLDKRFTIPNFPSRLLGYMDASLPILAATDINTDIGEIIENNNIGYWCESGDLKKFNKILNQCINKKEELKEMGKKARRYLENNYTAKHSANIILKHFKEENNV